MKPNAADLEFPATDPANAPARAQFNLGLLPAGSSRPADARDAEAVELTPTTETPMKQGAETWTRRTTGTGRRCTWRRTLARRTWPRCELSCNLPMR